MNQIVELLANVVTILGFPLTIFLVVKELKSNSKSITKLADSIKQQQIQADKIENVNMYNYEISAKELESKNKNDR